MTCNLRQVTEDSEEGVAPSPDRPAVSFMEGGMKYTKVKFNKARITRLYKGGKSVAEIARLIGYPSGHGNNRVRTALANAGVYKAVKSPSK